ncbi:phage antirepressor N-terminal domain-containing protein, partial [Chromohalobacter sp. 48-RD10]|uniref:phage antirepressor N-terminal domain-containing protein n=1 Tax=Chromohalobacter sp. 48-RD10 TaxID=2994063 RepID=UPI002469BFCE
MTAITASPVSVDFHGTAIPTFNAGGIVRVAMKPICDAIGLQWESQYNRIKRHPVLASTISMMNMVAADGKRRKLLTLPLNKLNGWLFGIDTNRVKPEIREKLVEYQAECFDVLSDYWQKGQATNPRTTPDERAGLRAAVTMLTTKKSLMHNDAYRLVHQRFSVEHI